MITYEQYGIIRIDTDVFEEIVGGDITITYAPGTFTGFWETVPTPLVSADLNAGCHRRSTLNDLSVENVRLELEGNNIVCPTNFQC